MKEIFSFLKDLDANNNREWFNDHKDRYLAIKEQFDVYIQELINSISEFDPEMSMVTPQEAVYRIYRDIRFSLDKTPYKNYMSAIIKSGGKKSFRSCYYVQLQPGQSFFAGGMGMMDPKLAKALRNDIYYNIEEFRGIVEHPDFAGNYSMYGESFKKVPSPYPADFEYADWLKYKLYLPFSVVPDTFFTGKDIVKRSAERLKILLPFNKFVNYTVEESM
ncbi:DUF2461 domain-containing protein [Gynurincola endophyticus]|uniref:DUF2461 domain-containing protein n=1 Tax=Gynurincola endophyticus TaxID=2479004 RepID=UPI000F8D4273|nr:DUF2461 domain-containing protein [Gynurincola endophyticus]